MIETLIRMSLLFAMHTCMPACSPEEPEETAAASQPVLGAVSFVSNCTTNMAAMLGQGMYYGRVAAQSNAFRECVTAAAREAVWGTTAANGAGQMVGPYLGCAGDPVAADVNALTDQLLAAARSSNAVQMDCSLPSNDVMSRMGGIDQWGTEIIRWRASAESFLATERDAPLCTVPLVPGCKDFRALPYSRLAAVAWHEAMHNHGYRHGDASSNATAAADCARDPAVWNAWRHTATAIAELCMGGVFVRSEVQCGDLESGCADHELRLVQNYSDQSPYCVCVRDPLYPPPVFSCGYGRMRCGDRCVPVGSCPHPW